MQGENQSGYPNPKSFDQLFSHAWSKIETIIKENKQNPTQQLKHQYRQYLDRDDVNYGLGAMFGAFIGDALGSYLEFQTKVSQKYADEAMEMPGGGRAFPFLLPGQFTDDSELASHLLKGLLDYETLKTLKEQQKKILLSIASQYNKWLNSSPFDIGHTTRSGLRKINRLFGELDASDITNHDEFFDAQFKMVQEEIAQYNRASQSNGSLMRITPLAFFISLLMTNSNNKQEKQFLHYHHLIRGEINMTHGSQAIFQTSEAYVHLLVGLIQRKDNPTTKVYDDFQHTYSSKNTSIKQESIKHVKDWIKESRLKPPSAITQMGWAKIAFTHTLITLRKLIEKQQQKETFLNQESYKNLIRSVLILGGDTDTNGAIVGGLIGAVVGFKNLPLEYVKKMFDLEMNSIKKSKDWLSLRTQYEPRRTFLNAMKLIQKFDVLKKQQKLNEQKMGQKVNETKQSEFSKNEESGQKEQSFIENNQLNSKKDKPSQTLL